MKSLLKLNLLFILAIVFAACRNPAAEVTPKPTLITDTSIDIADFIPTVGTSVAGTWSITDAVFTGLDATITVDGTSTTYEHIEAALQTAITAPANTSVTVSTTLTGVASAGTDVSMTLTFTANDDYIFEGSEETKDIVITFDIVVPTPELEPNPEAGTDTGDGTNPDGGTDTGDGTNPDGGTDTGDGTNPNPIIIEFSELDVIDFTPTVGTSVVGTWSITDAVFTGLDAAITVDGTSTTYESIKEALQTAITAPTNTSATVSATLTGLASAGTGVTMTVTFTADEGYIFNGNAETKDVAIAFDIVVVPAEPIVIKVGDLEDSNITPIITGGTPTGTWKIDNGFFWGSTDAKITFSAAPTITYTDIANAIKDAINITGVEVNIAYFNEPSGNVITSGHTLKATLTPSIGYVFEGVSQTKDIYISFNIEVPVVKPSAHHYADPNDEDLRTLQQIIDDAETEDGHTIAVTGTFTENITVNKTLTFIGYGTGGGVINGQAKGSVMTVNGAEKTVTIGEDMKLTGGKGDGSGIRITAGKVILNGGVITENGVISGSDDGAVSIAKNTEFEMNSGKITSNAGYFGGGLSVYGGTFTMNGGEISENDATNGGGIFIAANSTVTINAGTITYNDSSGTNQGNIQIGTAINTGVGAQLFIAEGVTMNQTTVTPNYGEVNDLRQK